VSYIYIGVGYIYIGVSYIYIGVGYIYIAVRYIYIPHVSIDYNLVAFRFLSAAVNAEQRICSQTELLLIQHEVMWLPKITRGEKENILHSECRYKDFHKKCFKQEYFSVHKLIRGLEL